MSTLSEPTVFSRMLRGSAQVILGFGGTQMIRFGSNLILTRLLFPEAFGLMAIVSVVLTGMVMFSDVGLAPSIMRSKRGEDPVFLDTAWVLQLMRGFALFALAVLLSIPLAGFYGEPSLVWLLPLAGISLLFDGLKSTRVETENRHLRMKRIVVMDLVAQTVAVTVCIALTAIYREVWTLAVAGIVSAAARCALSWTYLPGHSNRFRFERAAASELVSFGKWIFLSTVAGFFVNQSDRLILGAFVSMGALGVYNIGYFLASFAILAAGTVSVRMLIPLYREVQDTGDPAALQKLARLRMLFTAVMLIPLVILALFGMPIVDILFDPRFAQAGIIAAMLSCVQIIQIIVVTYDQAALAAGDSRNFFYMVLARATLQITALLIGVSMAGVAGAIVGLGVAAILGYVPVAMLARRHGVHDLRHDLIFGAIGVVVTIAALVVNGPHLDLLIAM